MANDLALRENTEIQGDIIAGFKKDHVQLLLLQFGSVSGARTWVEKMAPQIATTQQVARFNAQYSAAKNASGGDNPQSLKATWLGLGFTYEGLQFLTTDEKLLTKEAKPADTISAFIEGPDGQSSDGGSRAVKLGDTDDSAPHHWDFGGRFNPGVHAVLTVAADDPDDLKATVERQTRDARQNDLTLLYTQEGEHLQGDAEGKEHFGFVDGTSQPAVAGFDEPEPGNPHYAKGKPGTRLIPAGEFVVGRELTDFHRKVVKSAAEDYIPAWMHEGSFQVIRRLEQDVPGWWSQVRTQLRRLKDLKAVDKDRGQDWFAARLVGRWRDGTPVALSENMPCTKKGVAPSNDFGFKDDPDGLRTPLFSHLRNTNPRDGLIEDHLVEAGLAKCSPLEEEIVDAARIIRRGIPYGLPFDPMSADDRKGPDGLRGLVFVCYQSDLAGQFEFMQRDWINKSDFPPDRPHWPGPDTMVSGQLTGLGDGKHDVDGRHEGDGRISYECTAPSGDRQTVSLDFKPFVRTRGALYTFVPSITTLRRLALGDPTIKLPGEQQTPADQQTQLPPKPLPMDAIVPVPGTKDRFWTFQQGVIRLVKIGAAERSALTVDDDADTGIVLETVGPLSTWPALKGIAQLDTVLPVPDEQRTGGKSAYWVFHTLNGTQYYRFVTIADSPPYTSAMTGADQMMMLKWAGSLSVVNRVDAFMPVPDQQPGPDGKYRYWAFVTTPGVNGQRYRKITIAPVGQDHADGQEGDGNRLLTDWGSLPGVTGVDAVQAVPGKENVAGNQWFWVFHEDQYRTIAVKRAATYNSVQIEDDRPTGPWSRNA
ncbi:Dyp-type peroxidase [Streptomyces luteireticuli]|uniref:Dyp-type peroxidase n=1 Tax=Streptomyces luteireticuli TaxID=173858 RepID=UPI003556CBE6